MSLPRILVIKTGTAEPEIRAKYGDYERWFMEHLEGGTDRCDVAEAWSGETLPRPDRFGGLLITGSPASVRDEASWMDSLGRWALAAADAGVPVLGVCFGHQLLGEALGGRVQPNPLGGEYGTVRIELTEEGRADPLFSGLGPALDVQSAHDDALLSPPPPERAVRLAGNSRTRWQAFAAGPNLRAVQFHPEISAPILSDMLALRGQSEPVAPSAACEAVLANWDRYWVRRPG